MKFSPLKKDIRHFNNIGFDIETYGKDNKFYMGSMFFSEDNIKVFYKKEDIFKFILENSQLFHKSKIWAHNLQFDFLGIFWDSGFFKDFKVIQRGSDFISANSFVYDKKFNYSSNPECHHQNKIIFADTMSFFNGSLEKIGKIINIPKMEKPSFIGEKPKTREEKEYLEKYNINDSRITKNFADFLQQEFNNQGAEFKNTIASTSMDLFKRKYLKESYYVPNIDNILNQNKALYGGRTEIFNRGHITETFNVYDFNSLYPAVMKDNIFPDPNFMTGFQKISYDDILDYEGYCYAELSILESGKIPYLCNRTKQKLLFPIGKLKGVYTFVELRNALKYGYKLAKIGYGQYSRKSIALFKNFVEDLYKKRLEYKLKESPLELPVKIVMNSLYGKFGQKIDRMELENFYNLDKQSYLSAEEIRPDCDYYRVKRRMKQKEISFIIPIISAYVTSYARQKLYNAIKPIEDSVYYVDTDSIFTDKIMHSSANLGDLKLEYKVKEAYLIKPKFYYLLTDVYKDNKQIEKCKVKGVSNISNFESFMHLLKSGKVKFEKFVKLRESLIQGLNVNSKIEIEKNLDLEDTKRFWKNKISLMDFEESKPLILN